MSQNVEVEDHHGGSRIHGRNRRDFSKQNEDT